MSENEKNTITVKDLRQVKGLGPNKAQVVKDFLDSLDTPTEADESALASLQGISPRMAKEIIQVTKGEAVEASKPKRKSRKTKTKTKAKARSAPSNGHAKTARDVRVFARLAEDQGFGDVAATLRNAVSAKLDDEKVDSVTVTL